MVTANAHSRHAARVATLPAQKGAREEVGLDDAPELPDLSDLVLEGAGEDGEPEPAQDPAPSNVDASDAPVAPQGAWADRAACRAADPEIFYPEQGGPPEDAKAVCRDCPVLADCLSYALDRNERHGVWGGLSPEERRKIRAVVRRN